MKRLLLAAGVLALITAGAGFAWRGLRRSPAGELLDDAAQGFHEDASGAGRWFKFQNAQEPLRALRWLPPLPGGVLVAQALGQNDRQQVALARAGEAPETLLVLKPMGVDDGYWRFAALRDAVLTPDGGLVLLYQAGDPASGELPLVLDLDTASQQVRWSFRAAGDRLAVSPGGEAVYLYGGKAQIQRMALATAGKPAGPGSQPLPKGIDLPPEIQAVEAFLPTGAASFLVSHRNGLSAYQPGKGWTQAAPPMEPAVPCQDAASALVQAGRSIWWQPAPGLLLRVGADGRPLGPPVQLAQNLPPGDPQAPDGALLRVLGADTEGALWFALAAPAPPPSSQAAPVAPSGAPPNPAGAVTGTGAPPAAPAQGQGAAPAPAPAQGPGAAPVPAPAQGPASAPVPAPPQGPGGAPAAPAAGPSPEQMPSPSSTQTSPEGGNPGSTSPAPPAPDWPGYASAQGLDRVYRWNPSGNAMDRVALGKAWSALNPPAWAPAPSRVPGRMLAPEAGAFLVEGSQGAWWLPLSALPLAPVR